MPSPHHEDNSPNKHSKSSKGIKSKETDSHRPIANNKKDSDSDSTPKSNCKEYQIIINVPENNQGEKQAIIANTIGDRANSLFYKSIIINAIVMGGTLIVAVAAILQYASSNKASKIAKDTFEETRRYDSASIKMQQKSFDKDTAAIGAQIREFETENRAFIQAKDFGVIGFPNRHLGIQFFIADIGRQPAKIISGFYDSFLDTANYSSYDKIMKAYRKITTIRQRNPKTFENVYITEQSPQKKTMVFDKEIDTVNLKKIKEGYWNYYVFGEVEYIDLASNKKKKYVFASEIDGKNPAFYIMVYNENMPIK